MSIPEGTTLADLPRKVLEERLAKAEATILRLGSMEAFEVSRTIDKRHDGELLARIDYAQEYFKSVDG